MSDDRSWGQPEGEESGLPPPPPQGTSSPGAWDASVPGGPGWQDPGYAQPQQPQTNGPAVAALVCGIIALLLSWIPFVNLLAIALAIVAVVTGLVGMRRAGDPRYGQRGLAIGGLLTGVLGLLVAVTILAFIGSFFADPDVRRDIMDEFEREMERQEQLELEDG